MGLSLGISFAGRHCLLSKLTFLLTKSIYCRSQKNIHFHLPPKNKLQLLGLKRKVDFGSIAYTYLFHTFSLALAPMLMFNNGVFRKKKIFYLYSTVCLYTMCNIMYTYIHACIRGVNNNVFKLFLIALVFFPMITFLIQMKIKLMWNVGSSLYIIYLFIIFLRSLILK